MAEIHLMEEGERLRIRMASVGVDSTAGGGGRALFELFVEGRDNDPILTIVQEAPAFRAAAASGIPEPDYERVTAEATARLREDLEVMIEALAGMEDDIRRRGRPEQ